MNIKTVYDPPPIPTDRYDWYAYDADTHDGDPLIGLGSTEQEAIANLMDVLADGKTG